MSSLKKQETIGVVIVFEQTAKQQVNIKFVKI